MNISRKKLKGFTLIELLAILVLLGILLFIAIPLVNHIVKEAKAKICVLDAEIMEIAADNYVSHDAITIKNGESRVITLKELQTAGYISPIFSPYAKKTACTGYVNVTNEGKFGADYYTFKSELKCSNSCITSNYDVSKDDTGATNDTDPNDLKEQMKEKNNFWYFEGSNPNNWVKFGMVDGINNRGIMWRIVKIDNTGIKMVYEGLENGATYPLEDGRALIDGTMGIAWNTAGTNKWNEPASLEGKLNEWFSLLNIPDVGSYLAKINWKVGGVPYQSPTLIGTFNHYQAIDSSDAGGSFDGLSKNQSYVGTINAIDFMYTSDNEECSKSYLETGSSNECAYSPVTGELNNFLQKNKYLYWTLNARSDVSNMTWDISNSGLIGSNTVTLPTISVRPVLNLKLDSKFILGTGTIEDPYILEDYMVGLTDKPVITLNGDSTVYVRQYDTYSDQGATALDAQDGDLTSEISTTGSVNINVPGDYAINYNVSDSDYNAAVTVTRKVVVIERDLPIITLKGDNPTYVTITKTYTEPGATAYDINYGDISSDIVITGTVDTSTLGTYYVKYNITNEDGIKGPEVIRKVIVKVPVPKIELIGDNQVLVDIETSYTEQGATATDEVDGDLTSAITQKIEYYNSTTKAWQTVSTINTSSLAKYRIKYSVTNSYGANSYVYRNVQIVKVSGPIITYTPNSGSSSKKSWQTVINVKKNNYDIVPTSQKYLIKSNWSSIDVCDIDNYKSSYTDGQKITMSRGTAYYTIYARAFDTYGDLTLSASGKFKVDNSNPYIALNGGNVNVLLGQTYVDQGATAYDEYFDGNLTSKITITSNVDTSKLGTYYVTYTVTDSTGNTTVKSRKVTVYHPSAIIYLKGGSTIDLLYGTPYVEPGVTAYDEIDGDVTANIFSTGSVNHMREGAYEISYSVTNSSGYTSSRTRIVNVYIPKPEVTLKGSGSVKLLIHSPYIDQGATALDTLDGDLSSQIVITGSVNPEIPGNYTITYTVTNNLGKVGTATRKVTVYKSEPQITINGNSSVEILKTKTYVDLGATATDQIDGDISNKITILSNVNTSIAGSYYVDYTVTNSEKITSTKRRTVVVNEPIVTITPNGDSTINLPIGKSYVDAGATAYDELLGDVTSSITTTNNINPYTLGTYYVNYSITTSGVTKTARRIVNVIPLSGPVITLSLNGDTTYKKSNQTTVTVSKGNYDAVPSSFKYLWKTNGIEPEESVFTTSFTSGDTISTPIDATGKYYLFILAKDVYGNASILGSNTFYLDNIKPVLTLKENSVFETPVDGVYADPGVNVIEENSGLNSNGVVITSNIITGVIGTYTVTYNATDKAGNAASPITRTVSVVESRLVDAPGKDFVQLYDASYFVGSDPNNWVEFGNASSNIYDYIPIMWRIIKADGQGIKIIYEGVMNDAKTATIQNGTIGTGIWDNTNNLWNRPASIRTNVDNFYTNLNEPDKDNLTTKINWCVGLISSPYTLDDFKNNSCSTLGSTKSSIGLVEGKDYLLTSKDLCSAYNQVSCGTNNFLKKNYSYYTASSDAVSSVSSFIINSNGGLTRTQVTDTMNIRPVINLRSDILILGGEGTFDNPYKINTRAPSIDNDPPTVTFNPANSSSNLDDANVTVVVTDKVTGVNDTTLKYLWTTSSTQPLESTIINSFANGDKITIPTTSSGNYYLWVVAYDRKGNKSISKAGPYLSDRIAPVITLNGNSTERVLAGSTYKDAGAIALDYVDGNLTSKIVITSDINTMLEGDYTVTYTVSDNSGNKSTLTRKVEVRLQTEFEFAYTGNYQTFTAPKAGTYKIELWGASGGTSSTYPRYGAGAYTSGTISLSANESIYIYVGQRGDTTRNLKFNGGGYGGLKLGSYSGGGATDVRLISGDWNDSTSLRSRIMVSAGGGGTGGGATYSTGGAGSYGGALIGLNGTYYSGHGDISQYGRGGTQISGGVAGSNTYGASGTPYAGTFGKGGQNDSESSQTGAGGGGGGYYGGGAGGGTGSNGTGNGAGGGSSFISGYFGCNAIDANGVHTDSPLHYSGKRFTNFTMIAGNKSMPTLDGTTTMIGNVGNGYAKIAYSPKSGIPDILLNGAATVDISMGSTYVDAGATSYDIEDGDITANVSTTSTLNPNVTGTYTITYTVTDTDGNNKTIIRTVVVVSPYYTYSYTGNYQTFTAPKAGTYKIELWGASGGTSSTYPRYGAGAYTSGTISLSANESIYIYVGQRGDTTRNLKFNGGGYGGLKLGSYSGGGATDVRLVSGDWDDTTSLRSRIMVSAGGGGTGNSTYSNGGAGSYGGALTGLNGTYYFRHSDLSQYGRGGTQTSGGIAGTNIYGASGTPYAGTFGKGGQNESISSGTGAGGGGGGYYGGGAGGGTGNLGDGNGAGGGSSFISGYTGCNAIDINGIHTGSNIHYSGKTFTDSTMIAGSASMPTLDGATTMIGNVGNGYAKVSIVSFN